MWTKHDGLIYVNEIVDCADRSVVGYCVSKRCRAEEAVWALEDACLKRFGVLPRGDAGVTVRSDNGLVFASQLYRRLLRSYGLQQEFIHRHTPEQNGVVAAYRKTFKRECVWQHRFATIEEATTVIAAWIDRYNNERPHSSLDYLAPAALAGPRRSSISDPQCLETAGSFHVRSPLRQTNGSPAIRHLGDVMAAAAQRWLSAALKRVIERASQFIDRGIQFAYDVVVVKEPVSDNRNAYETFFARLCWGKPPRFISGYADFRAGRRRRTSTML